MGLLITFIKYISMCVHDQMISSRILFPDLTLLFPKYKPFPGGRVNGISAQNQLISLYKTMASSIAPCKLKGFLWYHGERNAGRPETYQQLTTPFPFNTDQ